jgi:heptosyltransferase I
LRNVLWATIVLLGGSADVAACERIRSRLGGDAVNLAGTLDFPSTGGWIQSMDLLIANDSGPVHMAAAVGTPVLAVFGPTDPARTGPYGPGHRVLTAALPCRPCYSRTCRRPGIPCLEGVTPERVRNAALEMLS